MTSALAHLPPVLTVEETAGVLRIGRGTAYEGVRSGAIPSVRIGRNLRVPRHALEAMLGIPQDDEPTPDAPDDEPTLELLQNDDAPGANRRGVRICSTTASARDDVLRAA